VIQNNNETKVDSDYRASINTR